MKLLPAPKPPAGLLPAPKINQEIYGFWEGVVGEIKLESMLIPCHECINVFNLDGNIYFAECFVRVRSLDDCRLLPICYKCGIFKGVVGPHIPLSEGLAEYEVQEIMQS